MALQRLTTYEPEDGMITVAIIALNKALELDADRAQVQEQYILDPDGKPLPETSEEMENTVETLA